jgi:dethiobiotin synthetase
MTNYFVTAIGTDSGKTLVSAILCECLHADYWKPIQAGLPRDADTVKSLISNTTTIIHPERYLLTTPASPHASAKIDGVQIQLSQCIFPKSTNSVVVEGAGGCLVPVNDTEFIVDLIPLLNCEVILVSNLYLGSINHTLLTVECLQKRNIAIRGIIFNGKSNAESERIILHHAGVKKLLHIQPEAEITKDTVLHYTKELKDNLNERFA